MEDFTPNNREESLWANIVLGQDNDIGDPECRLETILKAIWQSAPLSMEAHNRLENLLLAILNGDASTDIVPRNRAERILVAKINGDEVEFEPQDRIETLLLEWASQMQTYVGGGLVWNQLVNNPTSLASLKALPQGTQIIKAHKYLASWDGRKTDESGNAPSVYLYGNVGGSNVFHPQILSISATQRIWNASESATADGNTSGNNSVWLYLDNYSNLTASYINLFDLTQMFGSTIADYLYSLGSGPAIAKLHEWGFFTEDNYPYSVNTLTVVDKNNYKLFGYKNWVLGDAVLRGVPTLVDGELVWDGDEYQSGVITRKYGVVDLGTLTWNYTTIATNPQFRAKLTPDIGSSNATQIYNAICTKYPILSYNSMNTIGQDKVASVYYASVKGINVVDSSYTDAASFKTAMSGVYLVYELASPTHEVVSWNKIRTLVRQGKASEVFTVGDQLSVNVDGVPTKWDIIGIDVDTPYDTTKTHSLTLQTHDCYANYVFDAREALFAFPDGLEAGTYHFTITEDTWVSGDVGKTLQFTIANDIPSGGQLCFSSAYNATMAGSAVQIYASPNDTTAQEEITFTEGSDGTDLGNASNAISGNINSLQRAKLGNNRYSQSVARQILNSSISPYRWTPQNPWDRPSDTTVNGFMSRLDADFFEVLGESVQTTALNTVCDGGGSEQIHDKLFPVSRSQVFNTLENDINEGTQYPYYAVAANRIKYLNSTARYWWLRSPDSGSASVERSVSTGGSLNYNRADGSNGLAPACTII